MSWLRYIKDNVVGPVSLVLIAICISYVHAQDSGVPFVGEFGQVFAGPDDPYPGEDLRAYCAVATKQYSIFMSYRDRGIPKDVVKKGTWAALNNLEMDNVEIIHFADQIDAAYDRKASNDLRTWMAYGQECMDRRLAGTWYSYDWSKDEDYPRPMDPLTQQHLP